MCYHGSRVPLNLPKDVKGRPLIILRGILQIFANQIFFFGDLLHVEVSIDANNSRQRACAVDR